MPRPNPEDVRTRIDGKLKPPGSLGRLEDLAARLALTLGSGDRIELSPRLFLFAGDHGIAGRGVSIAPREVTGLMVQSYLEGIAAVNVLARGEGIPLDVVDSGVLSPPRHPQLIDARLGPGTRDISVEPAMDEATLLLGLQRSGELVHSALGSGVNVLLLGEMGIGNTSASSALLGHLLGLEADAVVGPGSGVDGDALRLKSELVNEAIRRVGPCDPREALRQLGGFEIVHLVGAMLAVVDEPAVCLVDGFITQVAACYAAAIQPAVRDHLLVSHRSAEPPSVRALDYLQQDPLLDLGLRLGEGTGAILAWPLLRAAAAIYNDMASFADAGVEL